MNIKKKKSQAGEMAQWVRAPDCSSEGPEFKCQQPHGGSQPSVMRSDTVTDAMVCLQTGAYHDCPVKSPVSSLNSQMHTIPPKQWTEACDPCD